MDRQVGRLLDGLREQGMEGDTLLIFASDNGPLPTFKGSRAPGLRGSKLSLYEGGVRVPLVVRWPGKTPAGRVDEHSVLSALDMLPTLCAIAGAALPGGATLDGQDISAALTGKPFTRATPLFFEYGRNDEFFKFPATEADRSPVLAMREGRWKLLVNADGSGAELYDVTTDAAEAKNVVAQHRDVAEAMSGKTLAWRRSLP
jgi:arylsulfatase A-like enzyme